MQKKSYVKKIDTIALSAAIFMLCVILYGRFIKNTVYCVILSAISLLALHLVYHSSTKSLREKTAHKKSDANFMNRIFQNLVLYPNEYLNTFFKQLLTSAGYICAIIDNQLYAQKNGLGYIVLYNFEQKNVNKNIIYSCERNKNNTSANAFMLFCQESSMEANDALKSLKNSSNMIFCKSSLFKEMKKQGLYPKIDYDFTEKKPLLKDILNYSFNKARFKSYFVLALIMYLFSYISPFKTYYLLFASVLFTFAAFSMLNKRFNSDQIQTSSKF